MAPTPQAIFVTAALFAAVWLPENVNGELLWGQALSQTLGNCGKSLVAAVWTNPEEVEHSLMDVLRAASSGAKQAGLEADVDLGLKAIEKSLYPLYKVLPKNKHGLLSHGTMRYALQRYFVRQYGMYFPGLDPRGEHWNTSSPLRILQAKVPGFGQHLLEERLPHGFNLRGAAILAATLEHLIHTEELRALRQVYVREGLDPEANATVEQMTRVLETYMVLLPGVSDDKGSIIENATALRNFPDKAFQGIKEVETYQNLLKMFHEVIEEGGEGVKGAKENNMTFAEAAQMVKTAWKAFGQWHNNKCKKLKKELVSFEDKLSGRVRLSEFYMRDTPSEFEFTETMEYLRHTGGLDETNPHIPRVIIPNYVNSATNCAVLASMHVVCCTPESEGLLAQIEEKVGGPMATPQHIVEIVQQLPSDTVPAPRVLHGNLVDLLEEIAKPHSGRIALHGRLFAQWMHHAYPREVPYPFEAGETRRVGEKEWIQAKGSEPLEQHASTIAGDLRWMEEQPEAQSMGSAVRIRWTHKEELLGYHSAPGPRSQAQQVARCVALFMVLAVAFVHSKHLLGLAAMMLAGDSKSRKTA